MRFGQDKLVGVRMRLVLGVAHLLMHRMALVEVAV